MPEFSDNTHKYLREYLDVFEPIFKKAFEKSEFNLIMSLLAIRGMSDDGWDPYENTEDVFEEVRKQQKKFKYSLRTNMNLWLYVHLIECSENYELIANLIKTIKGQDYVIANHVNRNFVNLKVDQKITRLRSLAKGTGYENASEPFNSTFNSRFRNAIGHGDYSIKHGARSGITIIDNAGFPTIFETQVATDLVNRALALHGAISLLRNHYTSYYERSKIIPSSPGFGHGSPIDVTLIVRKNHGVIGFRCIGGYDAGKPFETRLLKCLPYESKMIEAGMNDLPRSRVNRANKILAIMPNRLAAKLRPYIDKLVNR